MLTTIQRRVLRDISLMFIVSLFVITLMVMFIGVAREAFNQGLGVIGVMQLIPFALPDALSLAVPGTALFSVCVVYGRMSANNEFTTMQSVGISPIPTMWPAIALTTMLSVLTVGLINVAFTWGFYGVQNVVMSSVERVAYGVLQREHYFQQGPLSLRVREVNGEDLLEPVIHFRRSKNELVTITASKAVLTYEEDEQAIKLCLTNGAAKVGNVASFHFPDTYVQRIPLKSGPALDLLTENPSHMPMSDLPAASVSQAADIQRRESEIAVQVGFSLLSSRNDALAGAELQSRAAGLDASEKRLHRLNAEMHRRWASGFTCLAMSMIGIPLAIRLRTADTMTAFGIVFLPTLLVYYPLFALTVDMAKDGRIIAQGVWIANLVFIATSIVMIRNLVYRPA
ncbi:LptF/LptG family permease [Stieleria varia]|uniref:Putative permease YjgP/YjgQ family protein n=1 Tax=Stieleria varia TaxID=2528005 RepID=A0A5C6AEU8_9BACT|nr:LptF/LptG family permease [Stieleria varia]TWT98494.1 putative permease YjgP/YjgQ family protein [Stieleria varia]